MANPAEWGPKLWKIIHTVCSRLGTNTLKLEQNDEINYYNQFVKSIGYVLPCKICKTHFKNYALKNKKIVEYYNLKEYATNYFFNLHNEVNSEKMKALFLKEELQIYSLIRTNEFNSTIAELNTLLQSYVLYRYIPIDVVKEFNLSLQRIRNSIHL